MINITFDAMVDAKDGDKYKHNNWKKKQIP